MSEHVTPYFAVFNLHINKAGKRANKDVIRKYGMKRFQQVFPLIYRDGVMSIFKWNTQITKFWIHQVTHYVNEDK